MPKTPYSIAAAHQKLVPILSTGRATILWKMLDQPSKKPDACDIFKLESACKSTYICTKWSNLNINIMTTTTTTTATTTTTTVCRWCNNVIAVVMWCMLSRWCAQTETQTHEVITLPPPVHYNHFGRDNSHNISWTECIQEKCLDWLTLTDDDRLD